jgi:hypothetical protein
MATTAPPPLIVVVAGEEFEHDGQSQFSIFMLVVLLLLHWIDWTSQEVPASWWRERRQAVRILKASDPLSFLEWFGWLAAAMWTLIYTAAALNFYFIMEHGFSAQEHTDRHALYSRLAAAVSFHVIFMWSTKSLWPRVTVRESRWASMASTVWVAAAALGCLITYAVLYGYGTSGSQVEMIMSLFAWSLTLAWCVVAVALDVYMSRYIWRVIPDNPVVTLWTPETAKEFMGPAQTFSRGRLPQQPEGRVRRR